MRIEVEEAALDTLKEMAEQDANDAAKYRAWKPWIEFVLDDGRIEAYEANDFAIVKQAMQTK